MSYQTFRDSYLTEAEARLSAIDTSTASTNELLAAGALYKMAAAVSESQIKNALLRMLETTTGAGLDAWLSDIGNRQEFEQMLADAPTMATVAASSQAMAAVAASSTACAAIRQSSTAISAINASSAALDAMYAAATKFTYAGGSWSANPVTLVTGNFLLVRVRQMSRLASWANDYASSQYIRIGGAGWTATSGYSTGNLVNKTALPFVYDNAVRPVNDTSIQYYLYNGYEIAYLPA